jgi:arsenical pump membrane protein
MGELVASPWTVWGITAAATAGVIVRPFSRPEFIWAVSGAVLLVVLGLLPVTDALTGVAKGIDVYLFLVGMMVLAALAAWASGVGLAIICNLANNLPVGLVAGRVVQIAHVPEHVRSAVLIGVDLGPNLSVTGSLTTILWLTALRREGQTVSAWAFLKLGLLVMPTALVLSLAAAFLFD